MSTIHSYYITSQLFQLVEEQLASIEVEKKLRPLATLFVRLFDELDYNFSNEIVPEALERLIIFVQREGQISTVEFSKVQAFFTDENDYLHVRVNDVVYQVVEPAEIQDNEDDFDDVGLEYEENTSISLDDDESYIVIDGDEVIDEYELNEDITLDDENSYIVIDDADDEILAEDDDIHNLSFEALPIILDQGYAELITLAATTDIDELIEDQIDDLPAFKEVIEQLDVIRKEIKKETKEKKKDKKSKKKKDKKDKKDKQSKKGIAAKIEKKLFKYVKEKELEKQLIAEFIQLKKQINYILVQY